MSRLNPLPQIMVAPNGARRTKADHPALPITIEETVAAARASFDAGAQALHAHVRDKDGAHSLDAGAYRDLIAGMAEAAPDMPVQITTEAVGMFSPDVQRATVLDVHPEGASVGLREMWPEGEAGAEAKRFYATCAERDIAIQHIVYAPRELERLLHLADAGDLPGPLQVICVLGSYIHKTAAQPSDLAPFYALISAQERVVDWAICAFGPQETACLAQAHAQGGKMRIGLENNLTNADGRTARDNADRVADLMQALGGS